MIRDRERHSRQGFLGPAAPATFAAVRVGLIGLGGGGSHIAQQLAHLGFLRFRLFDPDRVELSNLNRLIGATLDDARSRRPKVEVAERLIRGLAENPEVDSFEVPWQQAREAVAGCDLIFACLDGFAARAELEAFARRHLIPVIDIGMTVRTANDEPPQMSGQVIVSLPGSACMRCMNFLNERDLGEEANNYGDAGPRPQVVFANGLLASHAVGLAVDLITGWSGLAPEAIYDEFDGNRGRFQEHKRRPFIPKACAHFPPQEVGPPRFEEL